MNTAEYVRDLVMPAAFVFLPPEMSALEARAMLLAMGYQESGFTDRRQLLHGPGMGWWQFEAAGGVAGVITHAATRKLIAQAIDTMRYRPEQCYAALADNDVLACIFARLLLWTHPEKLRGRSDPDGAWKQYLWCWRPGEPRHETWGANYARAWSMVSR